jgi:hypothetical protein
VWLLLYACILEVNLVRVTGYPKIFPFMFLFFREQKNPLMGGFPQRNSPAWFIGLRKAIFSLEKILCKSLPSPSKTLPIHHS